MHPSFPNAAVPAAFAAVVAIFAIVAPLDNWGNDVNDVAVTFERPGFEVLTDKDGKP